MKKYTLLIVIFCFYATGYSQEKLDYPETRKVDVVDDYFGTKVVDPYRWLEEYDSPEVGEWVKKQNELTESYLSKIPFREKIRERLTGLWDYEKYWKPFIAGGYYFYYKNDGMQNQYVLYKQKDMDSEPAVFIDPNTFSADGTVALDDIFPSNDGKYIAYSITRSGSDWREFYVMDIETGTLLDDHITDIKFSDASWHKDGFYYNKYPVPEKGKELSAKNESPKVYYHKLGTPQSEDLLIYEDNDNPEMFLNVYASTDERYLFMSNYSGGKKGNYLAFKDLEKGDREYTVIYPGYDDSYWPVETVGEDIYIYTNANAPRGKVIKYNSASGEIVEVISHKDEVLEEINMVGGKLIAQYLKDATSRVYIYDLQGNFEREIEFPAPGNVSGLEGNKNDKETFYSFTSYNYPQTIYKYDIESGTSSVFKKLSVDFNPEQYESKQVFYTSKDGTRVPMFITHRKGIKLDGNNPTLLYGYGGFNSSTLPSFSTSRIVFLENGGVYAAPNIRGGGEYGKEWHEAGMFDKKQNVFDDFIAAAEYLIKEGYTSSEKLAISGGSNGGLLVGAVTNQRPDLFRVSFPAVGVMDMLRYQKFTIGWAWTSEYGTSDSVKDFANLYSYSPYHNVKSGLNYPAIFVTTSDHDDRVVPSHSYKYVSALQDMYDGSNPMLIRIETDAGHGYGKPTDKVIAGQTDMWAFLFYNMGINLFEGL